MGLTMKKILNMFDDCNKFSLTGNVSRYNITISQEEFEKEMENINPNERQKYLEKYLEKYTITEEEFLNALQKIEESNKEEKRKIYEENKEKFVNYPEFDELYDEIKKECYEFDSEENRQMYINKHFGAEKIEQYKKIGKTDEDIDKIKNKFFHCSFISDNVGKTTKYGSEYRNFFWNLYHDIAMMVDRQKDKDTYCISDGRSPLEQIPTELKEHFLYYEVSFNNAVTVSGGLMINYYFELNEQTKKYLLQFRNDFALTGLEDLTLYKDDEEKFSSCTHEGFNSIESDYKNMSNDDIFDYINDESFGEVNDKIIEIVNKLIAMEEGTVFSFEELGISTKILMNRICDLCSKLNLVLVATQNKEHNFRIITPNGFEKVAELPAGLCDVGDLIEKVR